MLSPASLQALTQRSLSSAAASSSGSAAGQGQQLGPPSLPHSCNPLRRKLRRRHACQPSRETGEASTEPCSQLQPPASPLPGRAARLRRARLKLLQPGGTADSAAASLSCTLWPSLTSRRALLRTASGVALVGLASASASQAQASQVPGYVDQAWQALGGGPPDLYFPDDFAGTWEVESTLVKVDVPLGPQFVPDPQVVDRARREDLDKPTRYRVRFLRDPAGRLITDRAFNVLSMMQLYLGDRAPRADAVGWEPEKPNILTLALGGGVSIRTRVTRRSAERVDGVRLDTSEFYEQLFESPQRADPRVKASQCFTKYKWRSRAAAEVDGGPTIVATQVVSDYLTPYDGEAMVIAARNRPVVVYTYRMAFRPVAPNSRNGGSA